MSARNFGLLEGLTLTLGDDLNDMGGSISTRLRANFNPRSLRQSGQGLTSASSATGAVVSLGSGAFDVSVSAGDIFRVLSPGTTLQEAAVASRDSATQITLSGAGIGEAFSNASWEILVPADTQMPVESTLGFPSQGALALDDVVYQYTGKTETTFNGVTGLSPDGVYLPGAQQLHVPVSEVLDISGNFSWIDRARRELFVRTASGIHLDHIGSAYSLSRPPGLTDTQYRAVIEAVAYSRRGTVKVVEDLLTAIFGAGNFEVFEDLTGSRPVSNTSTIFVRSNNLMRERFAGKSFLTDRYSMQLSTATTGVLPATPIDIADVQLRPDPIRVIDEGGTTISSSGVPLLGIVQVTRDSGTFPTRVRPGDVLRIKSGNRRGQEAIITSSGGSSTLDLYPSGNPNSLGPLHYLPSGTVPNFANIDYEIYRPRSLFARYRPSEEEYVEFTGDTGTTVWTYAGTAGSELSAVTLETDASLVQFLRMVGSTGQIPVYSHTLRTTSNGDVTVSLDVRCSAASSLGRQRTQLRISDGAREVGLAFDADASGGFVSFVNASTGAQISGVNLALTTNFSALKVEKRGQTSVRLILAVNGLDTVIDTVDYSSFPASSNRLLQFGDFGSGTLAVDSTLDIKWFDWKVEDSTSLWNIRGVNGTFDTSNNLTDITAIPALSFGAGDVGRLLRIKNFTQTNATGGCVRGEWEVAAANSATEVQLVGPTSRRPTASFRADFDGLVQIEDQPDAFKFPDILGHTFEILAPHPNAGTYSIVDAYSASDPTVSLLTKYGAFATSLDAVSGEYLFSERTGSLALESGGAAVDWPEVNELANWRVVPRATGGSDAGPLEFELVDASSHTSANFTLRHNPATVWGVSSTETVDVNRIDVRSAHTEHPLDRTVYGGSLNSYNRYPFFLSDEFGVARSLLDLVTAAGVIVDTESLVRDDAGVHIR